MAESVPAFPGNVQHAPGDRADEKRAVLESIAQDLMRLEKEAVRAGEEFLAFLLANARSEAEVVLRPLRDDAALPD
jgi:hypothetical protein